MKRSWVLMGLLLAAACGGDDEEKPANDGDGDGDGSEDAGHQHEEDAGNHEEDTDAGGSECRPPASLLGAECTGDDSCSEDAPYCAIQPGQEVGYCTRTECLDDPCVCPADWDCFDLSMFQEGLPAICMKP